MKPLFLVANWKSHKTNVEAKIWIKTLKESLKKDIQNKTIIICPPFTLLSELKQLISEEELPFKLGAQNISPFGDGAYTGEVNGNQLKEFAEYVLVGHSERRLNFKEDNQILEQKINQSKKNGIEPIYFIQDENSSIPDGVKLITYEPPSSISPGPADSPENAAKMAVMTKNKVLDAAILYGGNVTSENAASFTMIPEISGLLVGRASLDPLEFAKIIEVA